MLGLLEVLCEPKNRATTGRQAHPPDRSRTKRRSRKTKTFTLKVKPAALKKVKASKKLLFKESAKVGKSKATVYKTLKLVRK